MRSNINIRPLRVLMARPVALHYRPKADKLTENLIKVRILTEVHEPTEWISAGHFVLKPNREDLRLITDFVELQCILFRPCSAWLFPDSSGQGVQLLDNVPAAVRQISLSVRSHLAQHQWR